MNDAKLPFKLKCVFFPEPIDDCECNFLLTFIVLCY